MRKEQIFISHTKEDVEFCDIFDRIVARVGIKAFRSEFEAISPPPWRTIKKAMSKSVALFFLVGKKLVESQESNKPEWRYTQNWIAYEMGLACQIPIDVWAICDDVEVNFPMPYINNYLPVSLRHRHIFDYFRGILDAYKRRQSFPYAYPLDALGSNIGVTCPLKNCRMQFNLHVRLESEERIICPQCLGTIVFPRGFRGSF